MNKFPSQTLTKLLKNQGFSDYKKSIKPDLETYQNYGTRTSYVLYGIARWMYFLSKLYAKIKLSKTLPSFCTGVIVIDAWSLLTHGIL